MQIEYSKPTRENRPAFTGEFEAIPGVDTHVNPEVEQGVIWGNGFNLGRYLKIGPQVTLKFRESS